MKKFISVFILAFVIALGFSLSTPSVSAATISGCGNSAGDDGYYEMCKGDINTHNPSNIESKLVWYNSAYMKLRLTGANKSYIRVYKNKPLVVSSNEGDRVTFEYDLQQTNGVTIQVSLEEDVEDSYSCSNYSGGDGEYRLCKGKYFKHDQAGIKTTINSINDSYVSVTVANANRESFKLYKNRSQIVSSDDGSRALKIAYYSRENGVAWVRFETEQSPSGCGHFEGDDGHFQVCRNSVITHSQSGMKATVTSFNDDHVVIDITGSTASRAWLYKNNPTDIYSSDGKIKMTLAYTRKGSSAAFVKMESERDVPSCKNYRAGDANYSLCRGKYLNHTESGIKVTVNSINDRYVYLRLAGAKKTLVRLYKNHPQTIASRNGNVKLEMRYLGQKGGLAQIKFETGENDSCHNSADGDGLYTNACKGSTIKHNPSGIKTTISTITSGYVRVRFLGAKVSTAYLYKNRPKTITSKDGKTKITLKYTRYSASHVSIEIKSEESMSCGGSAGGDGLYSGCKGDYIKHDSGIKVSISTIADRYVRLRFTGAKTSSTIVYKNKSKTITSRDGNTKLTLTYAERDSKLGAFVKIESEEKESCDTVFEEGLNTFCRNKIVKHASGDTKVKVTSSNSRYAYVRLYNAKKSALRLYKNRQYTATSRDGKTKLTFEYEGKDGDLTLINISSEKVSTSNNDYFSFNGYVKDEYGKAVRNAEVFIRENKTNSDIKKAKTNTRGYYSLSKLKLDKRKSYSVVVFAEKMSGVGKELVVDEKKQSFNATLNHNRKVEFSYRYNTVGDRTFTHSDDFYSGSTSVSSAWGYSGFDLFLYTIVLDVLAPVKRSLT